MVFGECPKEAYWGILYVDLSSNYLCNEVDNKLPHSF